MSDTPSVEPMVDQSSKCQNCLYWKQTQMPMGDCYADPPVFIGPSHNVQARRPMTKNTDICRHWVAK
jgi:hypothetical protein